MLWVLSSSPALESQNTGVMSKRKLRKISKSVDSVIGSKCCKFSHLNMYLYLFYVVKIYFYSCNGGVATVFAIFHLIECGIGENPIDYQNFYVSSWLGVGIMTSFAMANGDTWASELGILSKSDPILITTLKRVPRGTNGGVSVLGLIVSFLGGIFIGVFYYIATIVFVDKQSLDVSPAQWPIIILGGIAGLLGSLSKYFKICSNENIID